jgi:hypothetical protein
MRSLLNSNDDVGPTVLVDATVLEGNTFVGTHLNALAGTGYQLEAPVTIFGSRVDATTRYAGAGVLDSEILLADVPSTLKSGLQISNGPTITTGSIAPSADEPVGSIYLRTGGGAGTSFYVKELPGAGGGNWAAK